MAKNFIQNGDVIHITAKQAVKSGELVLIGDLATVAITHLAQGETGAMSVAGVWEVAAKSSDNITQGAKVYWDDSEKVVTTTKGSNKAVGIAWTDSPSSVGTVTVKLNA